MDVRLDQGRGDQRAGHLQCLQRLFVGRNLDDPPTAYANIVQRAADSRVANEQVEQAQAVAAAAAASVADLPASA